MIPSRLTAENGAKALLIGEFFETIKVPNLDYDYESEYHDGEPEYLTQEVSISWTNIKNIWETAIDYFQNREYNFKHECSHEVCLGFFGIDANGTHPECGHTNYLKGVEHDSLEEIDGQIKPCYEANCEKCGGTIEAWERVLAD